jgi:hypothetical protein
VNKKRKIKKKVGEREKVFLYYFFFYYYYFDDKGLIYILSFILQKKKKSFSNPPFFSFYMYQPLFSYFFVPCFGVVIIRILFLTPNILLSFIFFYEKKDPERSKSCYVDDPKMKEEKHLFVL